MRPCNTGPFEEMLQRWRAVGDIVSDLTGKNLFIVTVLKSKDVCLEVPVTGDTSLLSLWLN